MSKENDKITYSFCYEDMFSQEDTENRTLCINGEIGECALDGVVYHILRYNRLDMGLPTEERKPIILYLNSPGGTVSDGYGVIDAIITSKTPVYTVNLALCASMGFMIFIAGHKRFAMPHSEFLMHDGSTYLCDSTSKVQDRMRFGTEQIEKMTKNFVLCKTNITDELYNSKLRCEWWFLPQEAKDIGVVDYIIGEDCDMDYLFEQYD